MASAQLARAASEQLVAFQPFRELLVERTNFRFLIVSQRDGLFPGGFKSQLYFRQIEGVLVEHASEKSEFRRFAPVVVWTQQVDRRRGRFIPGG